MSYKVLFGRRKDTQLEECFACLKEASELLSVVCNGEGPIVLGCTELTLLHDREPLIIEEVCSPDYIIAEKTGQKIFHHERTTSIKDFS